jgi:elongator complex protein 6
MDCEELIQAGKLAIVEHDEDATTSSTSPGNPTIQKWLSTISMAAHSLPTQQDILLVLDSPDLLLGIDCFSADTLLVLIMELRALVKRTVILTSSDIFALSLDTLPPSLLQTQQQQILVSLVHQANFVLSSRTLDTGQAGDVSGVLRVTRGGRVSGPQGAQAIDKEFLYHIDTGRAAHVWQRGSDK